MNKEIKKTDREAIRGKPKLEQQTVQRSNTPNPNSNHYQQNNQNQNKKSSIVTNTNNTSNNNN